MARPELTIKQWRCMRYSMRCASDTLMWSLNRVLLVAAGLTTKCCVVLNECGQVTATMRLNDSSFSGALQW